MVIGYLELFPNKSNGRMQKQTIKQLVQGKEISTDGFIVTAKIIALPLSVNGNDKHHQGTSPLIPAQDSTQ